MVQSNSPNKLRPDEIAFWNRFVSKIKDPEDEQDAATKKYVDEHSGGGSTTYTAGENISIVGNVISATNTTYSAGDNISISNTNEISATNTTYSAGDNISISENNEISATNTTYTAGTNISISANNEISANDSYSLDEKAVGTWFNGDTIYKKTIDFGYLPNNGSKNVNHNISNIGRIIKVEQSISNGSANSHGFLNLASGTVANNAFNFYGTNTQVCVMTNSDRSDCYAFFTLFYTKSSS